ncbi:MAG TPA: carboxypeptidase-like regulatory domain-containing protein [Vicinamibacterales bacterium]|nr:carboxypeptidase-like regulatory domain-containing protein [Vicinamibacterales bacterium]
MSFLRLSALMLVAAAFPLAAQTPSPGTPATTARAARGAVRLLPGTQNTVLSTIQGNALTSTNGPLTDAPVRLRDARTGRIIDLQVTDKAGLFVFRNVEPGSYIVEMMSADNTIVLTASQILSVDAGDAVSAVVKLPFRIPPFAGVLSGNSAGSLAAIAAQAATSGITAVSSIGDPTCSLQ